MENGDFARVHADSRASALPTRAGANGNLKRIERALDPAAFSPVRRTQKEPLEMATTQNVLARATEQKRLADSVRRLHSGPGVPAQSRRGDNLCDSRQDRRARPRVLGARWRRMFPSLLLAATLIASAPAWGADACRESGSAPRPSVAKAVVALNHLTVTLVGNTAGFGHTWTISLGVRARPGPDAWQPGPNCPSGAYDWVLVNNLAWGASTWFFCTQPVTTGPVPIPVAITRLPGTLILDYNVAGVPLLSGMHYVLSIDEIIYAGPPAQILLTESRLAAWRFTGSL